MRKQPGVLLSLFGIGVAGFFFMCSDDPTSTDSQDEHGDLNAKISLNQDSVWPGTRVTLSATGASSTDDNITITECAWKFGQSSGSWVLSSSPEISICVNSTMKITVRIKDQRTKISYDSVNVTVLQNMYVDSSANGKNNGKCWNDAFNHLQDALSAAVSGITIHVAKGTYFTEYSGSSDTCKSFYLKNSVAMYGGYGSGGGKRDTLNKSILSIPDKSESDSIIVSSLVELDSSTVLDGFTIDGKWKMVCGISFKNRSSLKINNCNIINNNGGIFGGGVYIADGSPVFNNCKFLMNSASIGGGLYINKGNLTLIECEVADGNGDAGSGVYVNNCTALFNRCIFHGNYVGGGAGGLLCTNSKVKIVKCTFKNNYSDDSGTGIYSSNGELTVDSSSFDGNSCDMGSGGAIEFRNGLLTLSHSTFTNNRSDQEGGAVHTTGNNGKISCCAFSNNRCRNAGALAIAGDNTIITNCTYFQNQADDSGGAVKTVSGLKTTFVNCTFYANGAFTGSSLVHSGLTADSNALSLINCIFWSDMYYDSVQIYSDTSTFPLIRHCVVMNNFKGKATIDSIFITDPKLSPLQDNGGPVMTCAISSGGSAHNSGTLNVPATIDMSSDCRGLPRYGLPDIGAFEIQDGTGVLVFMKR